MHFTEVYAKKIKFSVFTFIIGHLSNAHMTLHMTSLGIPFTLRLVEPPVLSTKYSHLLQKHYVYFVTRSTYLATTFVHMCSYDDGEAGVIDNRPICSDDI